MCTWLATGVVSTQQVDSCSCLRPVRLRPVYDATWSFDVSGAAHIMTCSRRPCHAHTPYRTATGIDHHGHPKTLCRSPLCRAPCCLHAPCAVRVSARRTRDKRSAVFHAHHAPSIEPSTISRPKPKERVHRGARCAFFSFNPFPYLVMTVMTRIVREPARAL